MASAANSTIRLTGRSQIHQTLAQRSGVWNLIQFMSQLPQYFDVANRLYLIAELQSWKTMTCQQPKQIGHRFKSFFTAFFTAFIENVLVKI